MPTVLVPWGAVHQVISRGAGTMTTWMPIQRTIVAVDIKDSTERNNVERGYLRADMYEVLESALLTSGVTEELRDKFIDRGDGAAALIHPADQIPKPRIINRFIPALRDQLMAYAPDRQFQLRVAVHTGDVHFDSRGQFGEDLDVTFRLLDAPEFKAYLAGTTEPLALVVSDQMYRSAIRHGYDGIDASAFQPLVCVQVGGHAHQGWVQVLPAAANGHERMTRIGRVS